MKGVRKVTLDGDEVSQDDDGLETTTGEKEVFTVDTYEVIIDNK